MTIRSTVQTNFDSGTFNAIHRLELHPMNSLPYAKHVHQIGLYFIWKQNIQNDLDEIFVDELHSRTKLYFVRNAHSIASRNLITHKSHSQNQIFQKKNICNIWHKNAL